MENGTTTTAAAKYDTREAWLRAAAIETGKLVAEVRTSVPSFHVSVGFPKSRGRRAIGQCWDGSQSADGSCHVFICPTLIDVVEVLAVLLHEQVHATVGCVEGHKGAFRKVAKAVGLEGKMTATVAGAALRAKLEAIAAALGAYPHAALALPIAGSKGSRLRLFECECGIKVRIARDEFNATCDDCGSGFERKDK